MGVNPGEQPELWKLFPEPTEETSLYDFLGLGEREKSAPWRKLCKEFLGTDNVLLTELFFWSSRNAVHFRERFGEPIYLSKHLPFCRDMNQRLLKIYKPKAVVVTGVGA